MKVREIRVCEAPTHVEDCSGIGSTKDHFTPRVVIREASCVFRADDKRFEYLSTACHKAKDADTAFRATILKMQIAGVSIGFEQHLRIFLGEEYVAKYRRLIA